MYPIVFEVFGRPISSFGILVALGALLGGRIFADGLAERGYDRDRAWSILFWTLLGGVLGSKLWYTAEMVSRESLDVLSDALLSRGGLTWYGGLVGGALAVVVSARLYRIPIALVTHFAAPATAAGQCLGRIGCFLVGDDYGRPTDLPWGIAFPQGSPPTDVPVHPTMLYEAAWLAAIAALLWWRRDQPRHLLADYLVLAGVGRFLVEFLRVNPAMLGPLTNAQVTALTSIGVGVALAWFLRPPERRAPDAAPEAA